MTFISVSVRIQAAFGGKEFWMIKMVVKIDSGNSCCGDPLVAIIVFI